MRRPTRRRMVGEEKSRRRGYLIQRAREAARSHRQGHAWSRRRTKSAPHRAHPTAVPAFGPMGKGVMTDDNPFVGGGPAAHAGAPERRTSFLRERRCKLIFLSGQQPRYAKDVKVIQLDIAAQEIGH